jgi:hypothetical protein
MMYTVNATGQHGLIKDISPTELPDNAWSDGRNIRFRDETAALMDGQSAIYDPPSIQPYYLLPVVNGANRLWAYPGLTAIYASDGTTHTNISRVTGGAYAATADNRWNGGVLGGITILNNGVDIPQQWASSLASVCVGLSNWPSATAKVVRPFKYYLVALGMNEGGNVSDVRWSHPADPGTVPSSWSLTDPTKDCGQVNLAETSDSVVDCLPMRGANIIYKTHSCYTMQYVGGNDIFRFDKLSGETGMLTTDCAREFSGGHFLLTADDVVVNDGVGITSIINKRMRRALFNAIDTTYYNRSFVVHNPSKSEMWVCIPEVGQTSATLAYVWNVKENTWTVRNLPNVTFANAGMISLAASNTWDADAGAWDDDASLWDQSDSFASQKKILMATASQRMFAADYGTTFAGTNIPAYLEREGIHMGSPEIVKTITRIIPRINAISGTQVFVRVGTQMQPKDSVTWEAEKTFTVGSDIKVDSMATGRLFTVRFRSDTSRAWSLDGFEIDYQPVSGY